jgi:hypothetical protein
MTTDHREYVTPVPAERRHRLSVALTGDEYETIVLAAEVVRQRGTRPALSAAAREMLLGAARELIRQAGDDVSRGT